MTDEKKHRWTIVFDGGASPNPGIGSCAFKATNEEGKVIKDSWRMDGIRTNNEAEWDAVATAIEKVIANDREAIVVKVIGDSELVINQLSGLYSVKHFKLKPFYERVRKIRNRSKTGFIFTHVKRFLNSEMDDACKAARDQEPRQSTS